MSLSCTKRHDGVQLWFCGFCQWFSWGKSDACVQLDEQRRQAEADKLAAITELENRSRQFMVEKREKKMLEQKIAALQGQLLNGGDSMQVTPAVRCGLREVVITSACHQRQQRVCAGKCLMRNKKRLDRSMKSNSEI